MAPEMKPNGGSIGASFSWPARNSGVFAMATNGSYRIIYSIIRQLDLKMKWTDKKCSYGLLCTWLLMTQVQAESIAFTNLLTQGEHAEKNGCLITAGQFYSRAEQLGFSNAGDLCALTKKYCDLMYLADSEVAKKNLLEQAMDCARQAEKIDPTNSTAHACMAVCYAKECAFANIKTEVGCSRLIKKEAEVAISLNPKEDVAYYLLGRWNYGVANMGLASRAYVRVIYGGLPSASNEEAIKDFKQAIGLAPGHAIYYTGLANVYEATGQKNLALSELRKCASLTPLDRDDRDACQDAIKELNSASR
jgi:tetratricopeptide (TPR) repeat protein